MRCCTRSTGGKGGRRFPQPIAAAQEQRYKSAFLRIEIDPCFWSEERWKAVVSQNVPTQILILNSLGEHAFDVSGVDALLLWFRSGPSKLISSNSFSMIVCNRRAPMSSVC